MWGNLRIEVSRLFKKKAGSLAGGGRRRWGGVRGLETHIGVIRSADRLDTSGEGHGVSSNDNSQVSVIGNWAGGDAIYKTGRWLGPALISCLNPGSAGERLLPHLQNGDNNGFLNYHIRLLRLLRGSQEMM